MLYSIYCYIKMKYSLRKEESNLTGFDWLIDHQQNFDSNQKNLEVKEFLDKQVKQEKACLDMKNKAKLQLTNKQKV